MIQETWSRRQDTIERATRQGRAHPPGCALHPCGPLVAPPTYFFHLYIPIYRGKIIYGAKNPISTVVTFCTREIPSWGLFRSSARGGIDHGGLLHQHHSLSDDVWIVYLRPSGPYLLARWLLLSLWISIKSSPRFSWRSIRCNILLRCVFRDPMNCGFMIKIIYELYLNLL